MLKIKELILASNNQGKIEELQSLLYPIKCIPQNKLGIAEVEETGLTFIENAIIKARHASLLGKKPALADDSGLVVDALNGEPGIYSARYAGNNANSNENIDLLLRRSAKLPLDKRHAYFYCTIALVMYAKDPTPIIASGKFHGVISNEKRGLKGFGYDPIFYLPEYKCTVAELPIETKNKISHRAKALKNLLQQLS